MNDIRVKEKLMNLPASEMPSYIRLRCGMICKVTQWYDSYGGDRKFNYTAYQLQSTSSLWYVDTENYLATEQEYEASLNHKSALPVQATKPIEEGVVELEQRAEIMKLAEAIYPIFEGEDIGTMQANDRNYERRIGFVAGVMASKNTPPPPQEGKVRSAGTAMQELIEWISDTAPDRITEVRDKATSLLTKERTNIIDAWNSAAGGDANHSGEQYFDNKYKK